MNRILRFEGYNYTKGEAVEVYHSSLNEFLKKMTNQEVTLDILEIIKGGDSIIIELSNWPLSSRAKLFDLCSTLKFSHIQILKEYRGHGFDPKTVFEFMEENFFYIVQFKQGLLNMNAGDALFEYLEEIGYFEGVSEEIKGYFCKESKLRDWEIEQHPILDLGDNEFAILFRK